ncbi:MAG TPA: DUF4192 domain-containing protein [Nocardioidaceae bacterium]|nr:DUF4192 domain-containing protein [Nocardioidaceae bacterium]
MTKISPEPLAAPVRITDLGELLAGLPVFFGFRPTDSMVVICLEGGRGSVGFRLRVDLPPADLCDQLADYLCDVLRRNDATDVIIVACSDAPDVADPAVAALRRRFRSAGIDVREAVRCTDRRFWSYVCDDPVCCPPEGRPFDADASRLVAEAVFAGMEVVADRESLAARVGPVDGARRDRMRDATAAESALLLRALDGRDPATMQHDPDLVTEGARRVRGVVDAAVAEPDRPLSDADAAILSVWCSLDVVRDDTWSRIDVDNAADQLRIWAAAARLVTPPYEAAVLGIAGFSAWLSGDGALAWCAIERADQIGPDEPLVDRLRTVLLTATPPSHWVSPSGESVWRAIETG